MSTNTSRRKFLKAASLGGLMMGALPAIVKAGYAAAGRPGRSEGVDGVGSAGVAAKRIRLNHGDVILFQGDSITDAGRKKSNTSVNNPAALGSGYSFLAAASLLMDNPGMDLQIYNRGVSGNKVFQLANRWDADCLNLKPRVLSILVGVNDFWHTLVNGYTGTIKTYRDDYKTLLDRTKQQLPEVQLIIGEPYAVLGVKAVDDKWYPAFNEYRQAAKEIAASFGAVFIPYQEIYDKAQKQAPGAYWTIDGVHPSLAGAQMMAHAWLEAVKG